jgi:hypothetical protein
MSMPQELAAWGIAEPTEAAGSVERLASTRRNRMRSIGRGLQFHPGAPPTAMFAAQAFAAVAAHSLRYRPCSEQGSPACESLAGGSLSSLCHTWRRRAARRCRRRVSPFDRAYEADPATSSIGAPHIGVALQRQWPHSATVCRAAHPSCVRMLAAGRRGMTLPSGLRRIRGPGAASRASGAWPRQAER